MSIAQTYRSDQVRRAAGFNGGQWQRFIFITHEQAEILINTWKAWPHVPYNKKCEVLQQTNVLLEAEGCPAVNESVLNWRMEQTLGRLRCKERKLNGVSLVGGAAARENGAERDEQRKMELVDPPKSRPFDPVRDI